MPSPLRAITFSPEMLLVSVLVDRNSRVLIQGITGREGSFHTGQMRAFGTNVVAGVSPGKGGSDQDGVPIFDTVADAVAATEADVSGIFVPPPFAADAIMESAAAGIRSDGLHHRGHSGAGHDPGAGVRASALDMTCSAPTARGS